MRLSEQKSVIRLTPIDLTILRWLHTDWNTLENGVSVAFGFGVEVLELRASEGGGRTVIYCNQKLRGGVPGCSPREPDD